MSESPPLPTLDPDEQRVLGSLLEKEVTVPASYPMTLNAVRTACNQTSSREPVTAYDERHVHDVLRELKTRELVGVTWSDSGRRTMKYVQRLAHLLDLADDERALLTVLLLRGPQAPGALRSRTDRLHAFAEREDVEASLARMAERGLVRELPRRPGERDHRWVHLLGEVAEPVETAPSEPADRGEPAYAPPADRDERVRSSYGSVATAYADALAHELDALPFERWILERVAQLAGSRPVVEVGCGPGHVTDFLAALGADATGTDLTPAMVVEARRRFPDGRYEVGDLRTLMRPATSDGWGAVLAWYSLIHLAPAELPDAVAALTRPLAPGGWLVVAAHAGTGVRSNTEWFGQAVELDVVLHEPADLATMLTGAGLVDVEWYRRGPVVARGETSERVYLLAQKPIRR